MSHVLTLVAARDGDLPAAAVAAIHDALQQGGVCPGAPDWLAPARACDLPFAAGDPRQAEAVARALGPTLDLMAQPTRDRRKRLLLSDMDSTVVTLETLDAFAARFGLEAEVAAITERGMSGALGFEDSLRARMVLLRGQRVADDALDAFAAALPLMPGAQQMVAVMAAHGCHAILVSGGFAPLVAPTARRLGFHGYRANRWDVRDGVLTGAVLEPILGREGKRAILEQERARLGLPVSLTCAIGDGANDLRMIGVAGLGVAYHAKPLVRRQAPHRIDVGDLTTLLYFQGYRRRDFLSL